MNFRKNIFSFLLLAIAFSSVIFFLRRDQPEKGSEKENTLVNETLRSTSKSSKALPSYAQEVYSYILTNKHAPEGYVGGRVFQNREHRLPKESTEKRKIIYHEWDVHPRKNGVHRGAERLIIGDDGSAYFTNDHYNTFVSIKSLP